MINKVKITTALTSIAAIKMKDLIPSKYLLTGRKLNCMLNRERLNQNLMKHLVMVGCSQSANVVDMSWRGKKSD